MCPVSLHPPERCLTFLVQNLGFVLGRGKENGRGRLRCQPLFSWSGTLVAEGICTHFTKRVTEAQKRKASGLPWWSSGLDSTLAAQGAGAPSLEGTLGSHMPYGAGKKKKRKASAQVCPSRERGDLGRFRLLVPRHHSPQTSGSREWEGPGLCWISTLDRQRVGGPGTRTDQGHLISSATCQSCLPTHF